MDIDMAGPLNHLLTEGNFQEALAFRVASGNRVLKDHLDSCSANVQYTSKIVQNEPISVFDDVWHSEILQDVHHVHAAQCDSSFITRLRHV